MSRRKEKGGLPSGKANFRIVKRIPTPKEELTTHVNLEAGPGKWKDALEGGMTFSSEEKELLAPPSTTRGIQRSL